MIPFFQENLFLLLADKDFSFPLTSFLKVPGI